MDTESEQRLDPSIEHEYGGYMASLLVLIDDLRRLNATEARCRELSLAITNLEQAQHWLYVIAEPLYNPFRYYHEIPAISEVPQPPPTEE